MRKPLVLALGLCLLTTLLSAAEEGDTKAIKRVESAATVLDEIQGAPDQGIPQEVLGSAECVAVIPTLLKGGFIVGGRYGKGVASCRTPKGWSAPAFFTIGGGAGVGAGPVGRHASADTDWKMRAQVLTYSRARGAFAGLELSGA